MLAALSPVNRAPLSPVISKTQLYVAPGPGFKVGASAVPVSSAHSNPEPLPLHPPALIPPETKFQPPAPPGALTSDAANTELDTFTATLSMRRPPPVYPLVLIVYMIRKVSCKGSASGSGVPL